MTVYNSILQTDESLEVQLTESNDLITLNVSGATLSIQGAVDSVNGQTGDVVLTTTEISEGSNLYYTDARADARVDLQTGANLDLSFADTGELAEGPTNLYYTDARVQTVIDTNTADFATVEYVDITETAILVSANAYSDTGDTNTLTSANTYTDTGDTNTLTSANAYTDTAIGNIPPVDLSAYSTTVQTQAFPVSTFTNDAGYLTTAPASQTLSFTSPNLTISDGNTVDLSALSGGNVTSVNGEDGVVVLDTDDIAQGVTNLYYTDTAARNAISLTADTSSLTYNNTTGVFTYTDPTGSPAPASHLEIAVRNTTGVTIPANSAVYISGVQGNNDLIELAVNTGTTPAMGVTTSSIGNNSNGVMIIAGEIGSFDTSAYNENDTLYLSNVAGELTTTRPGAETSFVQNIGRVVRSKVNGTIIIQGAGRANDIPNLDSLHVFIGNTTAPERRQLTYTDILNTPDTPDLTDLQDVTTIAPDSGGMTITNAGVTTFEFGSDAKLQWRSQNDGGEINNWAFDNTGQDIFTGMHWRTGANKKMFRIEAQSPGGTDPGDNSYTTGFVISGSDNTFKSRQHNENTAPLSIDADGINLVTNGSNVTISDSYDLPNADGTADQVLTTDGTGATYWSDGGGGGASSLENLSDVEILNLQNNDILIYNGTASEWQNTNLGVSVTPTLSGATEITAGTEYQLTVTNHATYDDPNYFVEVYEGTNIITTNDNVTDNRDGTLSFNTDQVPANLQARVKVQDFGDLQSEIATKDFETTSFGGTYRYFRIGNFTGVSGTNLGLKDVRFYSTSGQTGTAYPSNMTSETTPTPFVVSKSYEYNNSTYAAWKAFDSSGLGQWWWLLSSPSVATDYVQIDLGAQTAIASMSIGPWYGQSPTTVEILASTTGAFAGEEDSLVVAAFNNGPIATVLNIG